MFTRDFLERGLPGVSPREVTLSLRRCGDCGKDGEVMVSAPGQEPVFVGKGFSKQVVIWTAAFVSEGDLPSQTSFLAEVRDADWLAGEMPEDLGLPDLSQMGLELWPCSSEALDHLHLYVRTPDGQEESLGSLYTGGQAGWVYRRWLELGGQSQPGFLAVARAKWPSQRVGFIVIQIG